MLKMVFVAMTCAACTDVVNNTVGDDGLGLTANIGYTYNCDLITQVGWPTAINEIHTKSSVCLPDGAASPGAANSEAGQQLAAYERQWQDDVCFPYLDQMGVQGGCYGSCDEDPHSWCFLDGSSE